jgi:hypothetical protein
MDFDQIHDNFHLPLYSEAYSDMQQFSSELGNVALFDSENDRWICSQAKGVYVPHSYYLSCFHHIPDDPVAKWLLKSKCIEKHKVFA